MKNDFKYELAFSLCARDLPLAIKINSRFDQRIKTFLYSEKDKEITFRNMLKIFPSVYKKEARFVIVLFRDEWGLKGWTKRESSAIEDRVHDEGEEFLLFVKLDDSQIPDWLTKKYAYAHFNSSNFDSLIETIEVRLNQVGSEISVETPVQRAAAIIKFQQAITAKENLLASAEGRKLRDEEVNKFINYLKDTRSKLGVSDGFREDLKFYEIKMKGHLLSFNFQSEEAIIQLLQNQDYTEQGRRSLGSKKYLFNFDLLLNPGWNNKKSTPTETENFYTSESLANEWINILLDRIDPRIS